MKFLVGLIVGLIAGIGLSLYWDGFFGGWDDPIYTVASIKSHEPQAGDNSETTLMIFINGQSGHVKELVCLFPPDVILGGGPNPSIAERILGEPEPAWTGVQSVRVLDKADSSTFGADRFYCDRIS